MRILLSENSRKQLFGALSEKNNSHSLKDLSKKLNIPLRTLQNWLYGERYIPERFISEKVDIPLEKLDKKEDNWGSVKGGRKHTKF